LALIKQTEMKKLLLLAFLLASFFSFAQTQPDYQNIRLEEKGDYKPADSFALKAASYVLSTPFEKDDINRLRALSFVIRWMSGTPDYGFTIDESVSKMIKGNDDLLGLYMAAMAKFCLENPSSAKDDKLVKLNAIKLLLAYCDNKDNNMKMTKKLEKLSEANKKGTLESSL
jgi:hypothetical protein